MIPNIRKTIQGALAILIFTNLGPYPTSRSAASSQNGLLANLPSGCSAPAHTPILYTAQGGDTLPVIAARFGIMPDEVASPEPLSPAGLLKAGQTLILPPRLTPLPQTVRLLPDSEIVYGTTALDFDIAAYLRSAGGYLGYHAEFLRSDQLTSAADIIQRVAIENSINPRLLLALLEYECQCVFASPENPLQDGYLVGNTQRAGLYGILGWMANQLSIGYYGWRSGALLHITLPDGAAYQIPPCSNAGSVALYQYFAARLIEKRKSYQGRHIPLSAWAQDLDVQSGFMSVYRRMFGDPWQQPEELLSPLWSRPRQPKLALPFEPGYVWSYSSGPHKAWETEGALAALDFAPRSPTSGCIPSHAWITAVANGPIVRSAFGAVVQEIDERPVSNQGSDGFEQTGWAILYMHVEEKDRVPVGAYLHTGDRVGHPSCEGGPATGTHLHIARKYNGEWIAADGPIPFIMDSWVAHAGDRPYEGTLTSAGKTVYAHPYGSFDTLISRPAATTRLFLSLISR